MTESQIFCTAFVYLWITVAVGWRYLARNAKYMLNTFDPFVAVAVALFWPVTVTVVYFFDETKRVQ
ncbi:hypothetical protein [Blastopirellula retiformator]|uniref:Uncharacterized protein n=1 Tax=Blastopirellula retiformator TaxID=2527970 RepID=A0A5C5UXY0_9BACT|nr:hypothetical protein [Blastopirellula retiformator]TWT30699.1 hypothetical protein Enr8_42220 [Blastopirellula retiformator]